MATVGSAMNASLNSKNRSAMKSGGLPSMNWIRCCAAPTANTAMWKFLIEGSNEGEGPRTARRQPAIVKVIRTRYSLKENRERIPRFSAVRLRRDPRQARQYRGPYQASRRMQTCAQLCGGRCVSALASSCRPTQATICG